MDQRREWEARQAADGVPVPPPALKAQLRQQGAAAVEAYLAKGGTVIRASALPWDDDGSWSGWREVTPDERTPLLGDQYTATRNGYMWERSRTHHAR
jgi:hypothetical protein